MSLCISHIMNGFSISLHPSLSLSLTLSLSVFLSLSLSLSLSFSCSLSFLLTVFHYNFYNIFWYQNRNQNSIWYRNMLYVQSMKILLVPPKCEIIFVSQLNLEFFQYCDCNIERQKKYLVAGRAITKVRRAKK